MSKIPLRIPLATLCVTGLLLSGHASAGASDSGQGGGAFIMLADLEHGLALIPEGSVVPRGLKVFAQRVVRPQERGEKARSAGTNRPLVFAYAPEARFTEARMAIEASEARRAEELAQAHAGEDVAADSNGLATAGTNDGSLLFYFPDGSYHRAYRGVTGSNVKHFSAYTEVFAAASDYDRVSLTAGQSSPEAPALNSSSSRWADSTGGYLFSAYRDLYTADPNFHANVYSTGKIIHYSDNPLCGRYGEEPCRETFSSTIHFEFP